MNDEPFSWLTARPLNIDPDTLAEARAYEAVHSLPGYPAPPPELRDRVLAEIRHLPVLPYDNDGPDIACLCCLDSGYYVPDFSDLDMPCPECPRGDWGWGDELLDDMERGR